MNVYVYPWSAKTSEGLRNPYLRNFIESLGPYCNVVNRDHPTSYGLFGVLPWLRSLDVVILHWAASIPDRRGAIAQAVLLRALMLAKSSLGFRLVYVLHDKVSHETTRRRWRRRIVRWVLEHADLVLTHAEDGVDFASAICPSVRGKVVSLPHPLESARPFVSGDEPFEHRRYDILVWGRMAAYKGLRDFVRFLNQHGLQHRYRILVAGQLVGDSGFDDLADEAPFITFDNRFIPDEELQALIAASKVILFPYQPESVIGSSALMNSLLSDAIVIGPNAGAFRDCARLGLISTFGDLSELTGVIDRALLSGRGSMVERRKAFAAQHTWEEFGRTVSALIAG